MAYDFKCRLGVLNFTNEKVKVQNTKYITIKQAIYAFEMWTCTKRNEMDSKDNKRGNVASYY